MTYQDQWLKGRVMRRGYRGCAERYDLVREFCDRFSGRSFTVCDIGSNMNYFGLRLLEDFPGCSVTAFEYTNFDRSAHLVRANEATRMMFIERKLSLGDVRHLSGCSHYDLVLAFSVLHHVKGKLADWLHALRQLGDFVLVEMAGDDSSRPSARHGHALPPIATILGRAPTHIKGSAARPIAWLPGVGR